MAPNASVSDGHSTDDSGSTKSDLEAEDGEAEVSDVEPDYRPLMGLCRQMCLSAGLMASDGGLVFLQLSMVPCLQTLGVPVSLVTVAGVISGSLALMGLPLLGWVSDGGTNPGRRKKPAVVLSALVFVAGYSLVISGCGLRLRTDDHHLSGTILASSTNFSKRPSVNISTFSESYHDSFAHRLSYFRPEDNSSGLDTNIQKLNTLRSSEDSDSESSYSPLGALEVPAKNNSNLYELDEWTADPLGVGIPLTGLLGILGFVFMDMGNDLNNSCLKSFVLTCTSKRQHNSLFVVGVLMSALGGCVAAILGVLDIAALLVSGTELDAVPTKTLLQAAFFLVLTIVCMLVTLFSAASILSKRKTTAPPSDVIPSQLADCGREKDDSTQSNVNSDGLASSNQSLTDSLVPINENADRTDSENTGECTCAEAPSSGSVCGTPLLTQSKNPSFIPADLENSSSLPASTRKDEMGSFLKPCDRTLSVEHLQSAHHARNTVHVDYAGVNGSDSAHHLRETTNNSPVEKCPDQKKPQQTPEADQCSQLLKCGKFSIKKTTLKMIPVCTSMFFMAGAWQSFNICATDYLGKVVYGGDPDADRNSQSYVAYQQGIKTGSLGVLMLNVAYVAVNLLQKKILALIGPKAEYLLVCALQIAVLLSLQLTHKVMVFYTAAVVYGLFRSVMYTVPFMLANTICHQAVGLQTKKGSAKVGSTMALMTAMMPMSYVLVSTITGPLIHATGDPAAPLYYAIVTTALAAFVFAFT